MENKKENKKENILINEYINQLSEEEKIVMKIAEKQLKSSFSIEKSIGYLNWLKEK